MVKIVSITIENVRSHGSLVYDDALEVVEDAFLLTHKFCTGVQRFGVGGSKGITRRLDIGLEDNAFYSEYVQSNIDKRIKLSNGKIITVSLPNQELADVYVKYAPMDWEYERVKRIFSFYGEIKKMEKLYIRESD